MRTRAEGLRMELESWDEGEKWLSGHRHGKWREKCNKENGNTRGGVKVGQRMLISPIR